MKKYGLILYFIFIALLLIPLYGLVFEKDLEKGCENRVLRDSLSFISTKTFLTDFDDYFKDNLGYKNTLTNFNANLKYYLFHASSHPSKAVVGKNNWVFYTDKDSKALNSYSRTNLFTRDGLETKVKLWENRKDSLNKLGISYYMSVYPNKSSIYSKYVPFNLKLIQKDTLSRVDQVIQRLESKNSSLKIIDTRPKIDSIKDSINLYYRFDSHWNDIGSFYAYQIVCRELGIKPYRLSDLFIDSITFSQGDLGRMAGLCNSRATEELIPRLSLKKKLNYGPQPTSEHGAYYWVNNDTSLSKRIVVFRDSYTNSMVRWLALHFKDGYYIATPFNYDAIQRLKPDIVIVASVERYFGD